MPAVTAISCELLLVPSASASPRLPADVMMIERGGIPIQPQPIAQWTHLRLHILDQPLPQLNTRDNIVAACHACNNERGGRIGWRTFLARKIVQHWSPK